MKPVSPAHPAPNVVEFPNARTLPAGLPQYVTEQLTGDPLGDLSTALLYINAAMVSALVDIEDEEKFRAKCRELGLDPDIARKLPGGPIATAGSTIRSLSRGMDVVAFARRQCDLLAQVATARAAEPPPTPSRRRKRP